MFWFALSHVHSFFELTELKHVTVQSFVFELKKLQTEALEDCLNSLNVFFSSNHWPGSLSTVELYYTITAEHYGNCDCRNCWKDWTAFKLSLLWGLTVRHWRALHWAKTGFLQLPCLAVWLMDCMEFATQFLAQTVPATVFHWQHCTPALLLHTGGVQLLWQVWIWDCGDPDWTGFERWCGHHWPDCAKYVLCDLTEHCQEDLGHWTDSCGTVH